LKATQTFVRFSGVKELAADEQENYDNEQNHGNDDKYPPDASYAGLLLSR